MNPEPAIPAPANSPALTPRIRLGVLGSGAGTNFDAIAAAVERGDLAADIVLVLSDVAGSGILAKAAARGIETRFVDPGPNQTRMDDAAQQRMADYLTEFGVQLVVCAGFMRRLKAPVLRACEGRILNIHPSLLPQFPGRDAVGQALAAGVAETGCTVHVVTEEIDAGPVLAQSVVPVLPGETRESLLARVNAAEQALYPQIIAARVQRIAAGDF